MKNKSENKKKIRVMKYSGYGGWTFLDGNYDEESKAATFIIKEIKKGENITMFKIVEDIPLNISIQHDL